MSAVTPVSNMFAIRGYLGRSPLRGYRGPYGTADVIGSTVQRRHRILRQQVGLPPDQTPGQESGLCRVSILGQEARGHSVLGFFYRWPGDTKDRIHLVLGRDYGSPLLIGIDKPLAMSSPVVILQWVAPGRDTAASMLLVSLHSLVYDARYPMVKGSGALAGSRAILAGRARRTLEPIKLTHAEGKMGGSDVPVNYAPLVCEQEGANLALAALDLGFSYVAGIEEGGTYQMQLRRLVDLPTRD